MREAVRGAHTETRFVVLDAEGTTHVDATGIEALATSIGDLRLDGVELYLARLTHTTEESLAAGGIIELLGPGHVFGSVSSAVAACSTFA